MVNNLYFAKERGALESGIKYTILQDSPNNFHVTVNLNDSYLYDCFSPTSLEELRESINKLGEELLAPPTDTVLTSEGTSVILYTGSYVVSDNETE